MAKWTSKHAIIQDLSVAQGCVVPASLKTTFGNVRPPAINIDEETEEEYFGCTGDVDFRNGPDLGLIQEMLSLVKEKTYNSDDDNEKLIVISKLNPTVPEFVSSNCTVKQAKTRISKTEKKRKHERNVALTSILDAINKGELPEPAMNDEQVKGVGSTGTVPPVIQTRLPSMFKRKQVEKTVIKKDNVSSSTSNVRPNGCVSHYVPSSLATDYYNMLLEKSKLKQKAQEDLWSKVEREMKEIDNRNKVEALNCSISPQNSEDDDDASSNSQTSISHGVEMVALPQQRHLLMGECVVCLTVKKHGYDIQEDVEVST